MPRPTWKGTLRLSLVSCPVYLVPATTRTKSMRLHQVWVPRNEPAEEQEAEQEEPRIRQRFAGRDDRETAHAVPAEEPVEAGPATRIALRPHDPTTGAEIERDEVVKGYEFERGQFVTFTPDELKALDVESTRTIDLSTFVPRGTVDPVYFNAPYYIYPDGPVAIEAFRVIGAAMIETGKLGIGRITLSRRERMVMVEPRGTGMVLITLRAGEEVRPAEFPMAEGELDPDNGRDRHDDHRTPQRRLRPKHLPRSISGGSARAGRGEAQGPLAPGKDDRGTTARRRSDVRVEAQPFARERCVHTEAETQGSGRPETENFAVAGLWWATQEARTAG